MTGFPRISLAMFTFLLLFFFFLFGRGGNEAREEKAQETRHFRFEEVGSFDFLIGKTETRATIYEDTDTGFKYLYVWGGLNAGGPAMVRLWSLEEEMEMVETKRKLP